jgi:predicted DNA binding protein
MLLQDLIQSVGEAATRREVAEAVCDRIVESDLCGVAWIGERAGANDRLVPKTVAGNEDSILDKLILDEGSGQGPGETALVTGEVQTIQDCNEATEFERWGAAAHEQGYESVAAIPLIQGDVVHGVLCMYSDKPAAFSPRIVESFAVLGEMVGYTLAAVQNRQLLSHDTVLELTFQSRNPHNPLVSVANEHECRLEAVGSVDIGATHLLYLSVDGASAETVSNDLRAHSDILDTRVVRTDDDGGVVELRVGETIQSLLLDVGARRQAMIVDDGTLSITVEAPSDADSRVIQEALATSMHDFTLTAKRESERQSAPADTETDPRDNLTDRQQEVLRTAFLSGYYAWPRDTNAEQLAETLGIASPTLHQHLRRAERNLIEAVFDVT